MFFRTNKADTEQQDVGSAATPAAAKKLLPSVLAHGTHILGNIVSDGVVDIDGSLEGNVKAEQVNLRANGRIAGDIVASVVHVYGEMRGLIRADAVHLYSSARMTGVIVHRSLTVEDGAFVDAKFSRMDNAQSLIGADAINSEKPLEDQGDGLIESAPSFVGAGTLRLIG